MITRSEPDQAPIIYPGVDVTQLTHRLGAPIRSERLTPPRPAAQLWKSDKQVILLAQSDLAESMAFYRFKGRRDKEMRVAQRGFDSFMTLGLAELYLIPKALWERAVDEDLQLTVWFNNAGSAVAYKWAEFPKS